MPKNRCACLLLLAMVLAWPKTAWAGQIITVTDMGGRKVQVPYNPERIVCLRPGTLRLVVYLKAQDKVAGVEAMEKRYPTGRPYWMAHPELSRLPVVGPGGVNQGLDLEAVLRAEPQVVFISYLSPAEADELQKKLKVPVVLITYGRFASFDPVVYDSLRLLGNILAKNQRAAQVVSFIEDARKDLGNRTAGIQEKSKPRVYIGGIGYKGSHGLGSTDTSYIPFVWAGVKQAAAGGSAQGHLFLGREKTAFPEPGGDIHRRRGPHPGAPGFSAAAGILPGPQGLPEKAGLWAVSLQLVRHQHRDRPGGRLRRGQNNISRAFFRL